MASPATLNPEHGVSIVRFQREPKLHLNLLRPADEVKNLFWLLLQAFEFPRQPCECLVQRNEFVTIFFQKFAARLERKAAVRAGEERKKELRPFPQTSERTR